MVRREKEEEKPRFTGMMGSREDLYVYNAQGKAIERKDPTKRKWQTPKVRYRNTDKTERMKTNEKLPDGTKVTVYWDLGEQYDDAGDGHVFMHQATGESEEGHVFHGSAIVCDGEWTEIEDIEYQENDKND